MYKSKPYQIKNKSCPDKKQINKFSFLIINNKSRIFIFY